MKKRDIIDLIKAHVMRNDATFKSVAYDIAKDFYNSNDVPIAEYIISLISEANTFVPQDSNVEESSYFTELFPENEPLYLPDGIMADITGIINAISKNANVNKFLFVGESGTGKTQTAKHLARVLKRRILSVDFDMVIDSKMGQTQKNIVSLFKEINSMSNPESYIVLFDEIDAIALDRINSKDIREMGRATSTLLKELDRLNEKVILIGTTNLFDKFDPALKRRFDFTVDFNKYNKNDLMLIADNFVTLQISKNCNVKKDSRLLHKIINLSPYNLTPGILKNVIKTAIVFSDMKDENDYLIRIYKSLINQRFNSTKEEAQYLKDNGFTCREISSLTGISKTSVSNMNKDVM